MVSSCVGGQAAYAEEGERLACRPRGKLRSVGAAHAGATYARVSGMCVTIPENANFSYHVVGAEVPRASFAELSVVDR
jgi:hypothetical protein